ncbi:cation:proton antiporter [Bradyrhizobium cenepequi]|uniref:cation:proton antiporter n=1 Tax=Bradyrhizobium cenepequi TaxID=2821403 RepID=UPI001CE32342|nr:sodium:proton antiporter [Bradyrhizobium cenepequi]MCA6108588.1 sodium:proton antiporter [Bradyrhizobium cenepequi]
MTIFDLAALLLTISAAFAFLNAKLLRLPTEIGVLVMGLAASLFLIGLELVTAQTQITRELTEVVRQIDFQASLMNGMLAFMLFAGALHVDWNKLKRRAASVALLATVGVLISTAIVGVAFWLAAGWLGTPIPLIWALVFGALISPTDPVAVLSTLKSVHVPEDLEVEMSGEALLNDGVGVVVFTILLATAVGQQAGAFDPLDVGRLFFVEALGGAIFGLVTGYIAYRLMRLIDDYRIEVLISLAAVMGTYSLAGKFHLSGPIAVVCAGLLVGERGPTDAMSETTQRYLFGFWSLIDAILNIVLFLLIGLEVLVLRPDRGLTSVALLAVLIVLTARWISVAVPITALQLKMPFMKGTIPVLTWGGVRGGISIALVLSMPDFEQRSIILAATYAVVVFSVVIQGLTLAWLVRAVVPSQHQG